MKQKDIALIVVIAIFSGVFSMVLSSVLITPNGAKQQKAEIVEAISPDFKLPDNKYFNKDSINPTQRITIGNNDNGTPFNDAKKN